VAASACCIGSVVFELVGAGALNAASDTRATVDLEDTDAGRRSGVFHRGVKRS
jgi:hypothetical protein